MSTLRAVAGGDAYWTVTVPDETGAPLDLTSPSDWTVVAALYDLDAETVAHAAVAQSKSTAGADWPIGKIVVVLPGSQTASLATGKYGLEIKATNGSQVRRWHHTDCRVEKGVIG